MSEPPNYNEVVTEGSIAQRYGEGARFLRQEQEDNRPLSTASRQDSDNGIPDEDDVDVLQREMEQFELDQTTNTNNTPSRFFVRASRASQRLASSINNKVLEPVSRMLVDPVANFLYVISASVDSRLSRFGNPLMFRRLIYVFTVALFAFIVVSTDLTPLRGEQLRFSGMFHNQNELKDFVTSNIRADILLERLQYMSSMTHLAGTSGDVTLAKYIKQEFQALGLPPFNVVLDKQSSYLTFPPRSQDDGLGLQLKSGSGSVIFEADMWEPQLHDHLESAQQPSQPFLALSFAGDAEGHVVYAGYGSKEEFRQLKDIGVDFNGAVVFVKYGKLAPGLKVLLAEHEGAAAVVLFNERLSPDTQMWPDGPDYPSGGVRRDHVAVSALNPGDILTPGWSFKQVNRVLDYHLVQNVAKIPSLPISWDNAKQFLEAIKGRGTKLDQSVWGNNGMPDIEEWWTGAKDEGSPRAYIKNSVVGQSGHDIWNVFGKIEGMEQAEKAIVVGAQRDAFCYGSVEPMSGTVILMELVRVFTLLNQKYGWTPLRSLYFVSWDASEQNLAGSTEWVEFNADELRRNGLVYINLDAAVSGPDLQVSGHPMFDGIVQQILTQITHSTRNETLDKLIPEANREHIATLDNNGDYLPFAAYAGMPSIDLKFVGNRYPRHSCFDSMDWMLKHGDPDFSYHKALAEVAAFLILKYTDEPVIDFNIRAYSQQLGRYVDDVDRYAKSIDPSRPLDLTALREAAAAVSEAADTNSHWMGEWYEIARDGEPPILTVNRQAWNNRLASFDKHLLDRNGIPGRNWFKHVIFGPQLWHPIEGDYIWNSMPGIRDSIEAGRWHEAELLIERTASLLHYSAQQFIG